MTTKAFAPLLSQSVLHGLRRRPARAQRLNDLYTVFHAGNDLGSSRQAQPVRNT